jgi:L-threonylcarbamoyladenylate synthase
MQSIINQAVAILERGGLVAMPTETVYGLGADAKNLAALHKIFQAKQRPVDHPLIVHLAEWSQLNEWASVISPVARCLGKAFWPGPLTLILPKASHVLDLITGGQATVGLRIPSHPVAQALLKKFGRGIAAPSANRFGRISPTTAAAVQEELGDAVDLILEGGQCEVGVESTIVDVSGAQPIILRPGMITAAQIEAILCRKLSTEKNNAPRVSGSLESHYAPMTPTRLISAGAIPQFLANLTAADLPVALMVRDRVSPLKKNIEWVIMSANPQQYAHDLYQTLRTLDKKDFCQIVIEAVPIDHTWDAVRDRLSRAASLSLG